MKKKKFAAGLLLSLTLFFTNSMPSYAGLGTMLAEHLVEHFIEEAGLNVLKGIANAGLIELEPYEGAYTNVIMNDRDFKLHDSSLLVFPIMDVTNTSFGGASAARDYFNVMGRATVVNYSNLKVNPNSVQDITLRKSDAEGNIVYHGMNAGFINFGDIELHGGNIELIGYGENPSLSKTTNGRFNLNDLSTLTYENLAKTLEENIDRPNDSHYIAYFINSNQTQVDAVTPNPTKGSINDTVGMRNGSIFMNIFDADIDRDDYRPYVNRISGIGPGDVIYNSGDIGLVRLDGADSILINDRSHITDSRGNELPENQQVGGYILSLSTNSAYRILNNEGALIDIYGPIADTPFYQPLVINRGTINYIRQNYGIIDGLNIGKIDFKAKSTAGIDKDTEGQNSGIIKNIILNVGNNLTFHNWGKFLNDDKQSSINVASNSKFYNEEGATVSNYEINNDYGNVYNHGTIDKNSTINNSYPFYNGKEDNTAGLIKDSTINNDSNFYNYGTIEGLTVINNDSVFENHGTIDVDKINIWRPSTWESFKNYGTLKANEVNNESSLYFLNGGKGDIKTLNNETSVYVQDKGTLSIETAKNTDGGFHVEQGGVFDSKNYTNATFTNDSRSNISVEQGGQFLNTAVENYGEFKNEGTTSVNKFHNNEGGVLTTGFDNLSTTSGAVNNDGLIKFSSDGEINNFDIKGRGEVRVDKNIKNSRTIHQGKVTVQEGKIFNTLVGDKYIVGETVNDGLVLLSKGGDIIGGFSGNGKITLDYDDPMSITEYTFTGKNGQKVKQKVIDINSSVRVINNGVLEFSDIFEIGNMSTVYTQANGIISSNGNSITNWGTLRFEGGTNYNTVEGSGGKTVIEEGSVFNEGFIDQELEIDNDAKFTSDLKNIGDHKFTNRGVFNLLGDLSGKIFGNGKTVLQDDVVKAANGTEIEGALNLNNATLNMKDDELSSISVGSLEGKGDLKIDVEAGKDKNNSDKINIKNASNNAILNLTNIKIVNKGETTEADRGEYKNALTYVDGNADSITYQIKGKNDGKYRALDKLNLYEFTLGDKGKLNVNITDNPLNLDDYINGTNSIITSVDAYNVILDSELEAVITGIGGYTPENKHWVINLNNAKAISAVNNNDGITITKDAILDIDGSHKQGASIQNFKTALINNGTLNIEDITFKNNANDIENNASLNLSGTNTLKNLTGTGSTVITNGQTEANNITQEKLNISSDALLQTSNLNVSKGIKNLGTIQALDGVNNSVITGTGNFKVLGNFTNNASITQDNLAISGYLVSDINNLHIKNDIINDSTLVLTGTGTLLNNIKGSDYGVTLISGDITNNAVMDQVACVLENGILTSSFDGLNKGIFNLGTFNLQGDLTNSYITGSGLTVLQSSNVNVTNDTTRIEGSLDLNNKTLDMRDSKGTNQTLMIGGALKGKGNLKIDVDMSNGNSDKINLMSKNNDAILNLNVINITKDIADRNDFLENYVNYVLGHTNGVDFQIQGEEQGELVVLTNGLKYTFTKGDDGFLNVESQLHTGGLGEYIRGEIIADNYSINDDMITLGNSVIGTTGGKNRIKRVFLNNGKTLSGDLLFNNDGITVANKYELILDGTDKEGATVKNFKTALINNGISNIMGITFENNESDILNNGRLNFSDNNTLDTISGNGELNVNDGSTRVNKSIIQNKININSDTAKLITNADGLKANSINNAGTLELTGGTLSQAINGGNIDITGNVSTKANNLGGTTNIKNTLNILGGSIKQEINSELDSNLNIIGNTIIKADLTGVLGNVNLEKGTLKLSNNNGSMFTNSKNFSALNNTTIDLNNSKLEDLNFNKFSVAKDDNVNLKIDFGDIFKTTDTSGVAGNLNLALLDVTRQLEDKTYTFTNLVDNTQVDFSNLKLIKTPASVDLINYNSGDLTAKKVGNLGAAIKNAMAGENLYQLSKDDDTAGFNSLLGGNLTIQGQGHAITKTGIVVDNKNTLTLKDTNIKDIKDAAITLNQGTKLNINSKNHNVIIDGNIISNDKNNIVNFNGNFIGFKGNLRDITANVDSILIKDGYDSGVNYNLNGGVLKYTNDNYLYNPSKELNSVNFNGGALDLTNSSANNIILDNISLLAPSNMFIDADLANLSIDSLNAASVSGDKALNIARINLLSEAKGGYTSLNFTQNPTLMKNINYTGNKTLYSPISRYLVDYDGSAGNFNFKRTGFNPAVLAAPVAAQVGSYLSQMNIYRQAFSNMDMTMLMTRKQRYAMKLANKIAYQSSGSDGIITFDPNQTLEQNKNAWFRPFTTFENVGLNNGPKVHNTAYGSLFGGDSEILELKHGWDMKYSIYAGYTGSRQSYDNVGIYQNGGTLGASTAFYKGNFFTGLTANIGANNAQASTMYGNEDFTMLATGIASKSGYNFEFLDGKFIIQPNYLMSYTFINTFDYTNKAGININSDPLHAIQIEPGIKFIGNLKNGWQPYAGISMVWNIMDKTKFQANDISLPDLSIKPFVRYGIGVRKVWGDRFSGFLQAFVTNGGRNGIGLQAGFNWALGKDNSKPITSSKTMPKIPKPEITLNNIK